MGLLDLLTSDEKKTVDLVAPVDGYLVALETVSDPMFAQEVIGPGFAIDPLEGEVVAPLAGRIQTIVPTRQAITIRAQGLDCLVHMGINTGLLKGAAFENQTEAGQELQAGDPLSKMDLDQIKAADKDAVVLVLFPSLKDQKDVVSTIAPQKVRRGQVIGKVVYGE